MNETLPPPQKRPPGHFTIEDKESLLNNYKAYELANPNLTKTAHVELTAKAAGVSVSSVFKILKEYTSTKVLQPPKTYCRRRAVLDNIDDGIKSALRRLIYSFLERNEQVTLKKILKAMHEDEYMPQLKRTSLRTLIKEIGLHDTLKRKAVLKSNIKQEISGTEAATNLTKIEIKKEEVKSVIETTRFRSKRKRTIYKAIKTKLSSVNKALQYFKHKNSDSLLRGFKRRKITALKNKLKANKRLKQRMTRLRRIIVALKK